MSGFDDHKPPAHWTLLAWTNTDANKDGNEMRNQTWWMSAVINKCQLIAKPRGTEDQDPQHTWVSSAFEMQHRRSMTRDELQKRRGLTHNLNFETQDKTSRQACYTHQRWGSYQAYGNASRHQTHSTNTSKKQREQQSDAWNTCIAVTKHELRTQREY
jgi:hypothetical protein